MSAEERRDGGNHGYKTRIEVVMMMEVVISAGRKSSGIIRRLYYLRQNAADVVDECLAGSSQMRKTINLCCKVQELAAALTFIPGWKRWGN